MMDPTTRFARYYDEYQVAILSEFERCYVLRGKMEAIQEMYPRPSQEDRIVSLPMPMGVTHVASIRFDHASLLFYFEIRFFHNKTSYGITLYYNHDSMEWVQEFNGTFLYRRLENNRRVTVDDPDLCRLFSLEHPCIKAIMAQKTIEVEEIYRLSSLDFEHVHYDEEYKRIYFTLKGVPLCFLLQHAPIFGEMKACELIAGNHKPSYIEFEYAVESDYLRRMDSFNERLLNHPNVRLKLMLQ